MRYNHFDMLPEKAFQPVGKRMTLEGGGSASSAPTQTTVTNTNIPDYAQPYVQNMLNAAQSQIYNPSGTGFNAYTPYSSNPADYVAGFSPLQQQAQSSAANLQTPYQYNMGTNLATQAGYGSLGAANQANQLTNQALGYGALGSQYGQQANLYGAQGAQQAGQTSQLAQQLANMYGAQGAQAGMQGLGIGSQAMGYGQQAANMANMGYGAGQNFANQATNPAAVQAYMNPYLQASLQPQLAEMQRQYGITGQQEQAGATQAGAFGGSREALMAAENQRNMNTAMNQAIGTGYNTAFNNAQTQQLAAANLGLQGMQAGNAALNTGITGANTGLQGLSSAMQGAGVGLSGVGQQLSAGNLGLQGTAQGISGAQAGMAGAQTGLSGVNAGVGAGQYGLAGYGQAGTQGTNLANIGTQQLGAQQGVIGTQAQQGATQQTQQQNIINQAIQNYATAQQYPYLQLGTLNSMLRGLPMQQASTSMYQAAPSTVSQLAGLGTAGLGAASLLKSKKGGLQEDQVSRYDGGGAIPMSMMNNQQLQQVQQSPSESAIAKVVAQGQLGLNNYINSNPQAAKVMSQPLQPQGLPPQQQVAQEDPNRVGISAIGTGDMTRMAGGGILAFADGDKVPSTSANRFSHEGSSPEDLAYDAALANSGVANTVGDLAGTGLKYTVGLPITAGKALLSGLSGLYESAHPTYDKSGNVIKASAAPVDHAAQSAQATADAAAKYAAWQAQNNQPPAQSTAQPAAATPANLMAANITQVASPYAPTLSATPAPTASPLSGLPYVSADNTGNAAPAKKRAGLPMPTELATKDDTPSQEFVTIKTQFGDVKVPKDSPLAGIDLTKGSATSAITKDITDLQKSIAERQAKTKDEALVRLGLGLMAAPARTGHNFSDALSNLGTAGTGALNYMGAQGQQDTQDLQKINQLKYEAAKADQARDLGFVGTVAQMQNSDDMKKLQLAQMRQMHQETLASNYQNLQARLAEINANKELSREEKEKEQQRLLTATASGELTRTQDSAYKTISRMHPELPAEEIQRQADMYTYNLMNKGPYAKLLNLEKPSDTPIAPPAKPQSWWDKVTGGSNNTPVQLTPQQLQAKAFVTANINSSDPALKAKAQQIQATLPQ